MIWRVQKVKPEAYTYSIEQGGIGLDKSFKLQQTMKHFKSSSLEILGRF